MSITLSPHAYAAATHLKKGTFVPFPDVERRNEARFELQKKNVVTKQGDGRSSVYKLDVDLAELQSKETKPGQAKARKASDKAQPKPTAILAKEFFDAVHSTQHNLHEAAHAELTKSIMSAKQDYATAVNPEEERGLLAQCNKLEAQRYASPATTYIEALKKVAGQKRFQGFDWSSFVSFDAHDYPNGEAISHG